MMSDRKSSLVMDLQPGDSLEIAGATVSLVHKSGRAARVRITAPVEMKIGKRRECEPSDLVPRMTESAHG